MARPTDGDGYFLQRWLVMFNDVERCLMVFNDVESDV
jgi:predicted lipid carrier protein YhbT